MYTVQGGSPALRCVLGAGQWLEEERVFLPAPVLEKQVWLNTAVHIPKPHWSKISQKKQFCSLEVSNCGEARHFKLNSGRGVAGLKSSPEAPCLSCRSELWSQGSRWLLSL